MTFLVERLADLRTNLAHLRAIRPRVTDAAQLRADLSLRNDILFSRLVVCQCVIDIAGELASRRGIQVQDYTEAVRALHPLGILPPDAVEELADLPGFRDVVVHEYVALDYRRVLDALDKLDVIERFVTAVASREREA